jgi:hypothetical protein
MFLDNYYLLYLSWSLLLCTPILHASQIFSFAGHQITVIFVSNTENKYLCLDPGVLIFVIKTRKNKSFLLAYLLRTPTNPILESGARVPIFRKVTKNFKFDGLHIAMRVM